MTTSLKMLCPKHNSIESVISHEKGYELFCGEIRCTTLPKNSGITIPSVEEVVIPDMTAIQCLGRRHLPNKGIKQIEPYR